MLCEMTNIWQNKTYLYPYRNPACHIPLESSLGELCSWMCIGKIKLGQCSAYKLRMLTSQRCQHSFLWLIVSFFMTRFTAEYLQIGEFTNCISKGIDQLANVISMQMAIINLFHWHVCPILLFIKYHSTPFLNCFFCTRLNTINS